MNLLSLIIAFKTLSLGCSDATLDSLFYNWNKATIQSIDAHIVNSVDQSEKSLYNNRKASVLAIWDIETDSLNKNSIRMKFLDRIYHDIPLLSNDFKIIEVMKSGEKVILDNYLISRGVHGQVKAFKYRFTRGQWTKIAESHFSVNERDFSTKKAKVPLGSSKIFYDVIISSFSKGFVKSDYFLYSTLSEKSKIASLILHEFKEKSK